MAAALSTRDRSRLLPAVADGGRFEVRGALFGERLPVPQLVRVRVVPGGIVYARYRTMTAEQVDWSVARHGDGLLDCSGHTVHGVRQLRRTDTGLDVVDEVFQVRYRRHVVGPLLWPSAGVASRMGSFGEGGRFGGQLVDSVRSAISRCSRLPTCGVGCTAGCSVLL